MIETKTGVATNSKSSTFSIVIKTFIVFAILGSAGAIAYYFMSNPAQTEKKTEVETHKVVVEVVPIKLGSYPVKIEVMGQIVAAHEAALRTQVSGEIIHVEDEFIPGGFFKENEEILHIDPSNYALEIKVKKATLRQANAALKLERGQQAIAKDELKIIEQSTGKKLSNSDLALRKPQLEQARADIDSAMANLELAELNLQRTKIKAPFNALISKRNTDLGNVVSSSDTLATLVSTDEYWIDVEIPVHNLRWLKFPTSSTERGSEAIITLDGGRGTRIGNLLKATGSLDQKSRLANMIISVSDPLLMQINRQEQARKSPLVLGDYVRVTLLGKTLKNAARIPQFFLRDNSTLWLEKDGKLIIQPVLIAYEDRNFSYIIKGLKDNDKIITSNIVTPINGMNITIQKDEQVHSNAKKGVQD